MSTERSARVYRALVRLYPRSFRDEYGTDMGQLFEDQCRDESTFRVWLRCMADLAVTVPARHFEARVHHRMNDGAVAILFVAVSVCAAALAVLGPRNLGVRYVSTAIAVSAALLAVVAWRAARSPSPVLPMMSRWWQLLVAGGATLAILIAVTTATGPVSDPLWAPLMLTFLAAITVAVAGLVLGVAHFASHRTARQ